MLLLNIRHNVHVVLQEGFTNRFPTIAEMASVKAWFAVLNVVRRRIVPADEFAQEHCGKTAAEWADHHGKEHIADELRFYVS